MTNSHSPRWRGHEQDHEITSLWINSKENSFKPLIHTFQACAEDYVMRLSPLIEYNF